MLGHALVHSFLLLSNPVTVCPLPTDGHSSCFQFLSTRKKIINATCLYKSLCEHMFEFLWGKYLVMELLGSMVSLCLTF